MFTISRLTIACVAGVRRGGGRGGGREFEQKTEDFLFLLPYPFPFIRLLRRLGLPQTFEGGFKI